MTRDVTTARTMVKELRHWLDVEPERDTETSAMFDKLDEHLARMDARTGRRDPSQRRKR